MNQRKKELERNFLNRFKELYSEFPKDLIQDSEEPDFLVENENGILGIEITELYRKPTKGEPILQEQESLRNQLADKTCKLYEQIKSYPITVSLHFNPLYPLKMYNLETLSISILDLVSHNLPVIDEMKILKAKNFPEKFPKELHAISIYLNHSILNNFWSAINSGWGYHLTIKEIQNRIDAKNKKTQNYISKNNCNDLWLIIVASGYKISTTINVSDDIKQNLYNSKFEKLFILNDMREVFELQKEINI